MSNNSLPGTGGGYPGGQPFPQLEHGAGAGADQVTRSTRCGGRSRRCWTCCWKRGPTTRRRPLPPPGGGAERLLAAAAADFGLSLARPFDVKLYPLSTTAAPSAGVSPPPRTLPSPPPLASSSPTLRLFAVT